MAVQWDASSLAGPVYPFPAHFMTFGYHIIEASTRPSLFPPPLTSCTRPPAGIQVTGNFGYFNVLTAVASVHLLAHNGSILHFSLERDVMADPWTMALGMAAATIILPGSLFYFAFNSWINLSWCVPYGRTTHTSICMRTYMAINRSHPCVCATCMAIFLSICRTYWPTLHRMQPAFLFKSIVSYFRFWAPWRVVQVRTFRSMLGQHSCSGASHMYMCRFDSTVHNIMDVVGVSAALLMHRPPPHCTTHNFIHPVVALFQWPMDAVSHCLLMPFIHSRAGVWRVSPQHGPLPAVGCPVRSLR